MVNPKLILILLATFLLVPFALTARAQGTSITESIGIPPCNDALEGSIAHLKQFEDATVNAKKLARIRRWIHRAEKFLNTQMSQTELNRAKTEYLAQVMLAGAKPYWLDKELESLFTDVELAFIQYKTYSGMEKDLNNALVNLSLSRKASGNSLSQRVRAIRNALKSGGFDILSNSEDESHIIQSLLPEVSSKIEESVKNLASNIDLYEGVYPLIANYATQNDDAGIRAQKVLEQLSPKVLLRTFLNDSAINLVTTPTAAEIRTILLKFPAIEYWRLKQIFLAEAKTIARTITLSEPVFRSISKFINVFVTKKITKGLAPHLIQSVASGPIFQPYPAPFVTLVEPPKVATQVTPIPTLAPGATATPIPTATPDLSTPTPAPQTAVEQQEAIIKNVMDAAVDASKYVISEDKYLATTELIARSTGTPESIALELDVRNAGTNNALMITFARRADRYIEWGKIKATAQARSDQGMYHRMISAEAVANTMDTLSLIGTPAKTNLLYRLADLGIAGGTYFLIKHFFHGSITAPSQNRAIASEQNNLQIEIKTGNRWDTWDIDNQVELFMEAVEAFHKAHPEVKFQGPPSYDEWVKEVTPLLNQK